ncbi:DUF6894 family protein [Aminobacter sp. MET-1]|uniref:DUF6894 family protein n=1 Tax=Aminobacter sp. MET-1 TaxID=2951085 RepID=UPI00226AE5B1|nr:hypothetical protein [Aminobacter sp. MET-1]MCX8570743.1 hypothetical protein [Aminobacter sp. MET-1]
MPKYRFEFLHEPGAAPLVLELADMDAARAEASQGMAESAADQVRELQDPSTLSTRINDEAGYLVASVEFGSVFADSGLSEAEGKKSG